MICEYCHTDRDGYVVNLPNEGNCKACVWKHTDGWHIHVSLAHKVQTRIKIKFCPMCGRHLERSMKLKIKEVEPSIKVLVDRNEGYCPCAVVKTPDTRCVCKEFREQSKPGLCHCGRYEKAWVDDGM